MATGYITHHTYSSRIGEGPHLEPRLPTDTDLMLIITGSVAEQQQPPDCLTRMMWTFKGVLKPLPPRQPHILAAWLFLHRCLVPVPGWAAPGAPGNNEQRPISHNLSAAAARWLRLSLGAHTLCQRCPESADGEIGRNILQHQRSLQTEDRIT